MKRQLWASHGNAKHYQKQRLLTLALLCTGSLTTTWAQPVHGTATVLPPAERNLQVQVGGAPSVSSSQRVALVIGNSAYKDAPLLNPVNDARAFAQVLKESGFSVTLRENIDQRSMLSALREFGDRLRGGGTGLFYYAGHGMQIKGRNYLIPVGASIEREDEVAYSAVDAQAVLDKMESAGNAANIMILDACRNNPFTRSTRGGQAGLAPMEAPVGTLVAYATSPGAVASDGGGANGLYTQHLLTSIRQPSSKIEDVFKQVRANVRRDSNGKQVPWEVTSLEGDFYFIGGPVVIPLAGSNANLEAALWDAVKRSNDPIEIRVYLNRYPTGKFATEARARLAQLQLGPPSASAAGSTSTNPPASKPPTSAVGAAIGGPNRVSPEGNIASIGIGRLTEDKADVDRRTAEILAALATGPGPGQLTRPPPVPTTFDADKAADKAAVDRRTAELLASLATGPGPGQLVSTGPGKPPRTPAASNSAGFTVGDRWRFQVVDKFKGEVVRNYVTTVDNVQPDGTFSVNKGAARFDSRGNRRFAREADRERTYTEGFILVPPLFQAGAKTELKFEILSRFADGRTSKELDKGTMVVKNQEIVKTPSGEFNAWRVEIDTLGAMENTVGSFRWLFTGWYVPELRAYVVYDDESRNANGTFNRRERHELTSFSVRSAENLLQR